MTFVNRTDGALNIYGLDFHSSELAQGEPRALIKITRKVQVDLQFEFVGQLDFLTPNCGSDEHQGKPAGMRALGGTGTEPLRHLDFLIHEPEHSVLLHGGGIPVTVPRAEAFAVHKLIVAVERINQAKSAKDIEQAGLLIEALAVKRPAELAEAWRKASGAGRQWRRKLESGRVRLPSETQTTLMDTVER